MSMMSLSSKLNSLSRAQRPTGYSVQMCSNGFKSVIGSPESTAEVRNYRSALQTQLESQRQLPGGSGGPVTKSKNTCGFHPSQSRMMIHNDPHAYFFRWDKQPAMDMHQAWRAEIELIRHRSFSTPKYPHEDAMVASKFILQGLISFD